MDEPDAEAAPPRTRLSATERRIVGGVVALLLLALAGTAPFAALRPPGTEPLLPAYAAAAFVLETVTAALLLSLFHVQRSPVLLVLAAGYVFSALMLPLWALSFPGVFPGLHLEEGTQVTASVAAVRRLGFPLFVLGYALMPCTWVTPQRPGRLIGLTLLGVAAVAALVQWLILSQRADLPAFMFDARQVSEVWRYVPLAALLLYALNITVLLGRRRTALDVWVGLVIVSLTIELLLISYLGGAVRLSVGWWAGRLYGLAAASIVLLALTAGTTTIYARLARTLAAERRARQNRLAAMEALSASIAHEVNQPLASMVTNADAALRWLIRSEPRIDKANAALERIVEDGHRANKIVSGIRTMFMKGAQERTRLDLNEIVEGAVRTALAEARFEAIPIEMRLDRALPHVVGNSVQLHQVLCNLIENGIDAIRSAGDRHRLLVVTTTRGPAGDIEVSVADSGTGVAAEVAERIFDPFVSTKSGGMGMGLMFCRTIVEAHGGRISMAPNRPRGAVFQFSLPPAMFQSATAEDAR
ncbi:ATP-binding protein [Ancylobacter terrae]|uniref:ATP-binding protein n=1 Tax=Ancylobacter sp. sgz301288 TaxID=3342077 RepID=UPI00385F9812